VAERRDLREQLRLHVLPGNEQLHRLDALAGRGLDEVLGLDGEETALLAVLARGEQLPDEPELLILARRDQGVSAPDRHALALIPVAPDTRWRPLRGCDTRAGMRIQMRSSTGSAAVGRGLAARGRGVVTTPMLVASRARTHAPDVELLI
jgi:hypothetical protein